MALWSCRIQKKQSNLDKVALLVSVIIQVLRP